MDVQRAFKWDWSITVYVGQSILHLLASSLCCVILVSVNSLHLHLPLVFRFFFLKFVFISTLRFFRHSLSTIQSASSIYPFLLILHLERTRKKNFSPSSTVSQSVLTPSAGHCPVNETSWEEVLSEVALILIVNIVS